MLVNVKQLSKHDIVSRVEMGRKLQEDSPVQEEKKHHCYKNRTREPWWWRITLEAELTKQNGKCWL